jgi:hypothetical protein
MEEIKRVVVAVVVVVVVVLVVVVLGSSCSRTSLYPIYLKKVVEVVEASETCQSSFDHELGA